MRIYGDYREEVIAENCLSVDRTGNIGRIRG